MAIELITKYLPYVDEIFTEESKTSYLTNQDFTFTGAKTVKIYTVSTGKMNDYGRAGASGENWSRYGAVESLNATTQEATLKKDRSFTFAIDKMDEDETGGVLAGASALARQLREVVVPEVDTYTLGAMCAAAGNKPEAKELTSDIIFDEIFAANAALDDANVPETDRVLTVTPETLLLMKKCKDDAGRYQEIVKTVIEPKKRKNGFIGSLDGIDVLKVSSSKLPKGFGFMLSHPSATVSPTKLADYKTHNDPPGINGTLVEGRIVYDTFILNNKKKAIYYQGVIE